MPQNNNGKPTKRELYAIKGGNKQNFDNGTVTRQNLHKYPILDQKIYLQRELRKKYKTDKIVVHCHSCAYQALYDDSGYITDEGILPYAKNFKHN
jgi:hypothetical protein